MSRKPIDFPLIDIKVEQTDCELKTYRSKHDSLKEAVLACEFEYESFDSKVFPNMVIDNETLIVQEYMNEFYVVDRLNQIHNLTGGY